MEVNCPPATSDLRIFIKYFRADSIAWNPHKMLCAPLQCSTFLVKRKVEYLERLNQKW